jgi:hypothetical protein
VSAELSRRVGKVVGYPPLCDIGDLQRREFQEALLEADIFPCPGGGGRRSSRPRTNAPKLRVVSGD